MGVDHFDDVRGQFKALWRAIERLGKATPLSNSSVGRTGIRFYDGGSVKVEGGGTVSVDGPTPIRIGRQGTGNQAQIRFGTGPDQSVPIIYGDDSMLIMVAGNMGGSVRVDDTSTRLGARVFMSSIGSVTAAVAAGPDYTPLARASDGEIKKVV